MNALQGFVLDRAELRRVGHDLCQPESVLAERDGTLWVSDRRGTVTRIAPDGAQTRLGNTGGEPNGLAMDAEGHLYVANLADSRLYKLDRDGRCEVVLSAIDGRPLGAVNFPFIDSQNRLWISVTSRRRPWFLAAADPRPDGYIILLDDRGARIVADGFWAANEVRLDAREEYLYVAETMARRVVRFRVGRDGSLHGRESFGPEDLGPGAYVDGITFDAQGNLWVATVLRNGLMIITPDGEPHTVFEEPNWDALDNFAAKVEAGTLTPEDLLAAAGKIIQFPTSITFAGPDLKTVYMGTLAMPCLITFRSPVPGLPMRHWYRDGASSGVLR